MNKLPAEMTVRQNRQGGTTIDMYNDRGSDRMLDIYIEKDSGLLSLNLNAVTGSLEIRSANDVQFNLSAFQVEMLVRFLQQKD